MSTSEHVPAAAAPAAPAAGPGLAAAAAAAAPGPADAAAATAAAAGPPATTALANVSTLIVRTVGDGGSFDLSVSDLVGMTKGTPADKEKIDNMQTPTQGRVIFPVLHTGVEIEKEDQESIIALFKTTGGPGGARNVTLPAGDLEEVAVTFLNELVISFETAFRDIESVRGADSGEGDVRSSTATWRSHDGDADVDETAAPAETARYVPPHARPSGNHMRATADKIPAPEAPPYVGGAGAIARDTKAKKERLARREREKRARTGSDSTKIPMASAATSAEGPDSDYGRNGLVLSFFQMAAHLVRQQDVSMYYTRTITPGGKLNARNCPFFIFRHDATVTICFFPDDPAGLIYDTRKASTLNPMDVLLTSFVYRNIARQRREKVLNSTKEPKDGEGIAGPIHCPHRPAHNTRSAYEVLQEEKKDTMSKTEKKALGTKISVFKTHFDDNGVSLLRSRWRCCQATKVGAGAEEQLEFKDSLLTAMRSYYTWYKHSPRNNESHVSLVSYSAALLMWCLACASDKGWFDPDQLQWSDNFVTFSKECIEQSRQRSGSCQYVLLPYHRPAMKDKTLEHKLDSTRFVFQLMKFDGFSGTPGENLAIRDVLYYALKWDGHRYPDRIPLF